jgi:hypothetical protein
MGRGALWWGDSTKSTNSHFISDGEMIYFPNRLGGNTVCQYTIGDVLHHDRTSPKV